MQLPHPHTFNIVLQTFDKSNLKEGVWQCAQLVDNLLASWFKRQRETMLQIVKKQDQIELERSASFQCSMFMFNVLCTVYCGRGCVSLESERGKELA